MANASGEEDDVERGKYPSWWASVVKAGGYERFVHTHGEWIDHPGRKIRDDGTPVFISEPYGLTSDRIDQLAKFQKATGCRALIDGRGSWHPGTIRIEISPPEVYDVNRYEKQKPASIDEPTGRWNFYVYGLKDPRDGLFHYVGQTCSIMKRARQHERGRTNAQVATWVDSLRDDNEIFEVIELEVVSHSKRRERERYWIAKLRGEGHPLKNGEYGKALNTEQQDWVALADSCRLARELLFELHNEASEAGCPKGRVDIDGSIKKLDAARSKLDSLLYRKFPEWHDGHSIFYRSCI